MKQTILIKVKTSETYTVDAISQLIKTLQNDIALVKLFQAQDGKETVLLEDSGIYISVSKFEK